MCNTCKIRWIDSQGLPTDDSNPAIGRVMLPARVQQFHGRALSFSASEWFPICAEHAKQLDNPGMEHWVFEPFLPDGWTWDRVEAERAKWDIASNMVPIATAPGCVAWGTINSVRKGI